MEAAMRDGLIYRKSFHDLLQDAAWFTVHSSDGATATKPGGTPRFGKIAILCSGLLVECVANCCINSLGLERESERELELAKTLVKYDTFLLARTGSKHVPRAHLITEKIIDLLSIRNSFVHPKVANVSYTQTGIRLAFKDSKTWQGIDIPRYREQWLPVHAERAFVAVSDFLNFFFFQLANFNSASVGDRLEVAKIFHSEIESWSTERPEIKSSKQRIMPASPSREVMDLIKKFDLDCAFLGYFSHDGKGNALLPKRQLGEPVAAAGV